MGYNKQLVYPAFNLHHFKQKSDPELPMIRNYRKHCSFTLQLLTYLITDHLGPTLVPKRVTLRS
jgi:hypothetical protein